MNAKIEYYTTNAYFNKEGKLVDSPSMSVTLSEGRVVRVVKDMPEHHYLCKAQKDHTPPTITIVVFDPLNQDKVLEIHSELGKIISGCEDLSPWKERICITLTQETALVVVDRIRNLAGEFSESSSQWYDKVIDFITNGPQAKPKGP